MSWRHRLFLFLVCGLMLPGGASLANGGQLHVVATHGILADVVRNVAGDLAEVSSLVPVGADPHAFSPTPSDLIAVAEADLVVINGGGYEEALLAAIEGAGEGGNIVNASACVQIRPFGMGMGHDDHEDEHDDDHGDEHADDDHDGDEHADDDHDDDEHADEHDDDDEHADEHDDDDEHADEHDDDEHADEHADDDHDDEHDDDEHADEHDDDHADEHDDDHADEMAGEIDCDDHDAEVAAIIGEEEDHAHFATLGRGKDVDCLGGHEHGAEHEHDEGGCDPHMWMDPHNVIYWALMTRDALSALDHDNEEAYAANAAAYAAEMVALEADYILPALEALPADKRVMVTGHDSLGYFATTFGFEVISTVLPGVSSTVEPSARDVATVVDAVRGEGVPAIFSDAHLSDVLVNMIAAETGVEVVGLHTDSLTDSEGPAATYIEYMRYNVSTIVEALKGDWR